jgi:hypothetical protein
MEEKEMKQQGKVLLTIIVFAILVLFVGISGAPAANPVASELGVQQDTVGGQVTIGGPVTPGLSPPVTSLPKAEPLQPGQSIFEVNPRQAGGYVPGVSQEDGAAEPILAPRA